MADDVKPDVIKGTQEVLGKIIKKPILTEKLLKKPPFRFLHDICTAAMKETGFFTDVLNSPEDMFENIKGKEGKIAFLQKVIAAVEAANGIKLTVRPNKIVAGLEPTKTNEFLQELGKALKKQQAENKKGKDQTIKTKGSRSQSREPKEEAQEKKQVKSTKTVENGIHDPVVDDKKKKTSVADAQKGISPRKKSTTKTKSDDSNSKGPERQEKKPGEKKHKEKPVDVIIPSREISPEKKIQEDDKVEEQRVNVKPEAGESLDVPKTIEKIAINGIEGEGDQNIERTEVPPEGDSTVKRKHTGKHKHRRPSIHNAELTTVPEPPKDFSGQEKNKEEIAERGKEHEPSSENRATPLQRSDSRAKRPESRSNTDKRPESKISTIKLTENVSQDQNKTSPTISPALSNYPKRETNLVREGTLVSRPRTGIRPTTARPASARPAAPRIRDRGDVVVVEDSNKPLSGKVNVVNVIVDKDVENEADDDNLISLETTHDIIVDEELMPSVPVTSPPPHKEGEHGHLVEQILEVQKELEDESKLPFSEDKPGGITEIKWESNKNSKAVAWEIEKLRANIQTLTRSVNPLGKLLDFFQEDVESIQKELEMWKGKNSSLSVQIANEKSITEQFVEPLKIHLKEIQQSIEEQFDQISVVKANIIRNNNKIRKLLASG